MPANILLFVDSLSVGGTERQVVTDSGLLSGKGFRVTVGYFGDSTLRDALPDGVDAVRLPAGNYLTIAVGVARLCRQCGIDLVQSHMWAANFIAALSGWFSGTPVILTEHGLELWRTARHIWTSRLSYCLARKGYAVCDATRQVRIRREGISPAKIDVMYNCFDPRRLPQETDSIEDSRVRRTYGIPQDAPVVGFLGRLIPVKRLDLLVAAAEIVTRYLPNTVFLVVGDGPERASLERAIETRGLACNFRLVGYQRDTMSFFEAMDVSALTSEREALSIALLEASASGLPAVVFGVGGNVETISDGETGYVVPFGDMEVFSSRLVELLQDPGLREDMSRRARERAWEVFSPGARQAALVRAYQPWLRGMC